MNSVIHNRDELSPRPASNLRLRVATRRLRNAALEFSYFCHLHLFVSNFFMNEPVPCAKSSRWHIRLSASFLALQTDNFLLLYFTNLCKDDCYEFSN